MDMEAIVFLKIKQLKANYNDAPENLISAIVESNKTRKNHIAEEIIKNDPKIIGIYRLSMKSNSDNFRSSAILDILKALKARQKKIIIFEPNINDNSFMGIEVINDLKTFKKITDIIIANRIDINLDDVLDKVYTRDLYLNN